MVGAINSVGYSYLVVYLIQLFFSCLVDSICFTVWGVCGLGLIHGLRCVGLLCLWLDCGFSLFCVICWLVCGLLFGLD